MLIIHNTTHIFQSECCAVVMADSSFPWNIVAPWSPNSAYHRAKNVRVIKRNGMPVPLRFIWTPPFHSQCSTPRCEKHEQSGASVYLIAIKVFLNITVWILPFHYYKIGSISCMRHVCSGCNIFLAIQRDNYYFLFSFFLKKAFIFRCILSTLKVWFLYLYVSIYVPLTVLYWSNTCTKNTF